MFKSKMIFVLIFGFLLCTFSYADEKIKYKTFKFYDYVVKYPVEPFLPEKRNDSVWEKWKIYITHKRKVLFTLDAPDSVNGVKMVNIDNKGKKELVIEGIASGSGCFFTWYVFGIVNGKLKKTYEIRDECVTLKDIVARIRKGLQK